MARHHMTADGPVPFTAQEEAERDAEEAADDARRAVEAARPKTPTQAEILDGLLDGGQALASIKQRIAAAKAAKP